MDISFRAFAQRYSQTVEDHILVKDISIAEIQFGITKPLNKLLGFLSFF